MGEKKTTHKKKTFFYCIVEAALTKYSFALFGLVSPLLIIDSNTRNRDSFIYEFVLKSFFF